MAGHVTPYDAEAVTDQLDLAADLVHLMRHDAERSDDPDSVEALAFLEQLVDGLIWDIGRDRLMVGRCDSCTKVHIWQAQLAVGTN